MKALAAALPGFLAIVFAWSWALAWPGTPGVYGSAPGLGCPQGTMFNDGCPQHNPNGSFYIGRTTFFGTYDPATGGWKNPNFPTGVPAGTHGPYNQAQQSGQAYYELPPWNEAGVDYPIGYDATKTLTPALCGLTNLPNPVTGGAGTPTCPTGVVYPNGSTVFCGANPSYGQSANCVGGSYLDSLGCTNAQYVVTSAPGAAKAGYYAIVCNVHNPTGYTPGYVNRATGNPAAALEYIDFSPSANAGNCVVLRFGYTNNTLRIAVDNNKFVNGYGCMDTNAFSSPVTFSAGAENFDFDFTNNDINGMSTDQTGWGSSPCTQGVYPTPQCWVTTFVGIQNSGTSTKAVTSNVMYNAFYNITGIPMSGFGDYSNLNLKYNYFANFNDYCNISGGDCQGLHGAVIGVVPRTTSAPIYGLTYAYNTCLYPAYYGGAGTTCFSFLDAIAGNNQYQTGSVDHNVTIGNKASNPPSAFNTTTAGLPIQEVGAVLTQSLHNAGVVSWTISDNFIDATGAYYCAFSSGDGALLGSATNQGYGSVSQPSPGADIILTVNNPGMRGGGFYAQGTYPTPFVLGQYNYQNVWFANSGGAIVFGAFKPYGTDGTTGMSPGNQNGVTYALYPNYAGLTSGTPVDVSGGYSVNTYVQNLTFPGTFQTRSTNVPHGNINMTVNFNNPGSKYPYVTVDTHSITVVALQWQTPTCAHT